MSQKNVEIVRELQPGPDVDLVELFRDDDRWSAFVETVGHFFHPDCEFVAPRGAFAASRVGLDGFRAGWLDWLTPWATYRVEIEQAIDCGDRVVILPSDFGGRGSHEVRAIGGAVWTVRDERIVRVEFYLDRAEALAAVGLEE
jgi:ketosteroid isomerase-like protein